MKKQISRWIWLVGMSLWMSGCPGGSTSPPCKADADCPPTQRCLSDQCRCEDGLAICGTTCVSLLNSSAHCGACGQACPKGTTCLGGSCGCPAELLLCGQACHDPRTDALHCGGCGKACKTGERCSSGRCLTSCPAGTPDICGQSCVQLLSEARHCGACDKACPTDQTCKNGACSCPAGKTSCDGACVFVDTDLAHCGACKTTCKAGERCALGLCVTSCPASVADVCFGACVDLQMDSRHCGGCGKACPAGQSCQDSLCLCPEGTSLCGGRCVDAQRDGENCGGCGTSCKSGEACASGSCVTSCPKATEAICFGGCYDTQGDPRHCGGCGKACQPGEVCQGGACACPSGQTLCEGRCTDTSLHPRHCGGCAKACKAGEVCTGGSCQTSCPTPTPAICYGGCVALETSTLHCGRCGRQCRSGQRCDQGRCTCPSGFLACGETCVDPMTDPKNCGTCGKICKGGESCQGGDCKTSCPVGQENCGGCTHTQTDPKHCGGCGNTCEADQACVGGACVCGSGRADCSGRCIDVLYNADHCGACGKNCKPGESCLKGVCACPPQGCSWLLQPPTEPGERSSFRALVETSQGELILLGIYSAKTGFSLGSTTLPPPTIQGHHNLFFARVDQKGALLSAKIIGSVEIASGSSSVRIDAVRDENDQIYASIDFYGRLDIALAAGKTFASPDADATAFVKLTPQGDPVWAETLKGSAMIGRYGNNALFASAKDGLFFSGKGSTRIEYSSTTNRLCSILSLSSTTQAVYGVLKTSDGSCQSIVTSQEPPANPNSSTEGILYRPLGQENVLVAGRLVGQTQTQLFGQTLGTLTGSPDGQLFILKVDSQGAIVWKSEWDGLLSDEKFRASTLDGAGHFTFAGTFQKTVTTPTGEKYSAQGSSDTLITSLDPQGKSLWTSFVQGPGEESAATLLPEPSGDFSVIVGASNGSKFDAISVSSTYPFAVYKALLSNQGKWKKVDFVFALLGGFFGSSFLSTQTKQFCIAGGLRGETSIPPFFLQSRGETDAILLCIALP